MSTGSHCRELAASGRSSDSPTTAIAAYIVREEFDTLPEQVREGIKLHVLDTLGCALGGHNSKPAAAVRDFFVELSGREESAIIGTRDRVPALHAAYVNCYLANALELDDTYADLAHPGCATVMPALAVAERLGDVSGAQFLTAIVVGYEVLLRVARAIVPSAERADQVLPFANYHGFGSAAAAAKLLRLPADEVRAVLGAAGVTSPVPHSRKNGMEPEERPYTSHKGYAWAAMGAISGALLLERGFRATRAILDGPSGYWAMVGSDRCDWEAYTEGLGRRYLCLETSYKPWPACRWMHSMLDAVETLCHRHSLTPALVRSIQVRTFGEVARKLWVTHPADLVDATFSAPYMAALILCGRQPQTGLSEADLRDPDILQVAQRMEVVEDPQLEERRQRSRELVATVTMDLIDGRRINHTVTRPKGDPENPMSAVEVEDKFRRLAEPRIGASAAAKVIEAVQIFDRLKTVTDLVGMLTP